MFVRQTVDLKVLHFLTIILIFVPYVAYEITPYHKRVRLIKPMKHIYVHI